ncbi:MAG: tol-pal system YbgF family protein, partial [Candidatus Hodarchaeota archaeon]
VDELMKYFDKIITGKAAVEKRIMLGRDWFNARNREDIFNYQVKIALIFNQEDTALNYLQNALGVAKSGEIPIDFILKIHYKLGVAYYKRKEYQNALNHFRIIISFLEKEKTLFEKDYFLGMAYLYIGLICLEQDNITEAKINFKNTYLIGDNNLKIKLSYFLFRGLYYKNQGNLPLTQKFLRAGLDSVGLNFENTQILKVQIDLILELSEFYIHYRRDSKKALYLLENLENHITLREISNMKRGIRWNLLMSDLYKNSGINQEKSQFYLKQSQKLKNQLQTIGVSV